MRLVPDAIRDILLYIEQNQTAQYDCTGIFEVKPMSSKFILDELRTSRHYTREEAEYSLRVLYNENILYGKHSIGKNNRIINLTIEGITYNGHQFLDSIRNDTIWNKVKEKACKFGVLGFKGLYEICSEVIKQTKDNPELFSSILDSLKK